MRNCKNEISEFLWEFSDSAIRRRELLSILVGIQIQDTIHDIVYIQIARPIRNDLLRIGIDGRTR